MRNSDVILLFGALHLICFTLIYSLWLHNVDDFEGFVFYFGVSTVFSLPSFLIISVLNYLKNTKKMSLPDIWFYVISIISLCSIFYFKPEDERRIFPVFEEPLYTLLTITTISHSIAYGIIHLIKKLPNKTID